MVDSPGAANCNRNGCPQVAHPVSGDAGAFLVKNNNKPKPTKNAMPMPMPTLFIKLLIEGAFCQTQAPFTRA